jgi:hypothetical protein
MTVTASTTIAGVSVLTKGKPSGDPFDIAVSHDGIEIRRTGQRPRRMSWERVSEWELEERADQVVLTLRGEGAATPLLVTGWSVDDLELLLRTVTAGSDAELDGATAAASAVGITALDDAPAVVAPTTGSGTATPASDTASDRVGDVQPPAVESRKQRRRSRRLRVSGKLVVTVALLLVLAAAVTLVLLQSAGVIDWGFLGPTA